MLPSYLLITQEAQNLLSPWGSKHQPGKGLTAGLGQLHAPEPPLHV